MYKKNKSREYDFINLVWIWHILIDDYKLLLLWVTSVV